VDQLVLGDHLARLFEQRKEDREDLGREGDGLAAALQETGVGIDQELVEAQERAGLV
jgi:hypothetical protein